jgi:serine/threonine-protein kinase
LELNPNLPDAHAHYGWYLLLFGRREEALQEMKTARDLSPLNPLFAAWYAEHLMGLCYPSSDRGQFAQGMNVLAKALEVNPDSPIALHDLGRSLALERRFKESIAAYQKANEIDPQWGWGAGVAYAMAGQKDEARKVAAGLERASSRWNTWCTAEIYSVLGDKEQAFKWLEAAFQQRHSWIPWIKVHPSFDPLRDDPRFAQLLHRMNLGS